MNGDAQTIINKLTEVATRQEERHVENKADIKIIFKKLTVLDHLPCKVHVERMSWLNRYIVGLAATVSAVILWIVKLHLTTGG